MFLKHLMYPQQLLFRADDGGGNGGDGGAGGDAGGDGDGAGAAAGSGGGDAGGSGGDSGEQTPPWGSNEDFDPKRAWKLIQDVRADAEAAKKRADAEAKKAKQYEDRDKTEGQKLEERATNAEKQASSATAEAARLRVALKKGLTETQAKRLVGESEEELEKDADELLESFKSDGDGQEPPPGRPRERLRPGAAPAATPEETDPAKLAEEVPRGW